MRPFCEVKNMSWNWYTILYSKLKRLVSIMDVKSEYWVIVPSVQAPKTCCHSNCRYLHQRLLSIVSWFSESRHLFLARSKINHTLASLGSPGSRCVCKTKNLPRNIILWAMKQSKSGKWIVEGVGSAPKILSVGLGMVAYTGLDWLCDWEMRWKWGKESPKKKHELWKVMKTITYHTVKNTYQWILDSVALLV